MNQPDMPLRPTRSLLFLLLGGIVFLFAFEAAFSGLPADYYQSRDDGVITMSHA